MTLITIELKSETRKRKSNFDLKNLAESLVKQ